MTENQVVHALNIIPLSIDGLYVIVHTPSKSFKGYVTLDDPLYSILRIHSTTSTSDYFIDIATITAIEGFVNADGQEGPHDAP